MDIARSVIDERQPFFIVNGKLITVDEKLKEVKNEKLSNR